MTDPRNDLETENLLLQQTLEARNCELEVLHELSGRLGQSWNDADMFRTLFSHLSKCIETDVAAGLLAVDGRSPPLLFIHNRKPLTPQASSDLMERMTNGLSMMGGCTVDPLHVATMSCANCDTANDDCVKLERVESFFQVPIIHEDGPIGMIALADGKAEHFNEDVIRLIYTVANHASMAVKQINDAHHSERRRLRTMFDHLSDGIILLDENFHVTAANVKGQQHQKSTKSEGSSNAQLSIGEIPISELISRFQSGDISDIKIEGNNPKILEPCVISLGENPLPERWILVLRDVTEAREAVNRRDRFLAMLAHELRNPLSPILNAVRILDKPDLGAVQIDQALKIIGRQTNHIAVLVDDLLEVSRFLHGKVSLNRRILNVCDLINCTAENFQSLAQDRGIDLECDVPDDLLLASVDETRLTQVLSNLLGNAFKFTSSDGKVLIACRLEADEVCITVKDSGIGLEADEIEAIFEPFTQVEDTLARSQGGLGLGLALVSIIVKQHDGTVSVHSEGHGKGSEFEIRLPAVREESVPLNVGQTDQVKHYNLDILLVEDITDARKMQQVLLEMNGYRVVTAPDGPRGLEQYRRHRPSVCLIDIGLPLMNGYEVARSIRQIAGNEPILFALTGYGQSEVSEQVLEAGFDHHLVKPIDFNELEKLISQYAELRLPSLREG